MLELLRKELEKYKIFDAPDDEFINALTRAIPFPTVPEKMKLVIAISHLANFAGQFRRNIRLWDDTPVPINSISFVIAGSGANKDSSNDAVRKCFAPGYKLINAEVEMIVKRDAIKAAQLAGEELYNEYDIYKDYMKPIPPVFMSITTGPGLIQHINDIGDLSLTSSFLYSGEISDELAYNPNVVDNIKVLSEVYDLGIKETTYTKDKKFRSKEINGQPVSALFMGSPGHILYDEATKKKFYIAFMSKLARRSWFCYEPNDIPEPDFLDAEDRVEATWKFSLEIKLAAKEARAAISEHITEVTKHNLPLAGQDIIVTDEVFKLFEIYKRYNREVVATLPNRESTYALIRAHLQWKALKLAGAIALTSNASEVTEEDYALAMRFCELLDSDMNKFEHDLNKAPHERFSDYIKTITQTDNKAVMSIHDIKKHGFVASVTKTKLQELVKLCAGYDMDGIYSIVNEDSAIQYEPITRTDVINVSFKPIDTKALNKAVKDKDVNAIRSAKSTIAGTTASGYDVAETSFEELGYMLEDDFVYSPFIFTDGVRGRDNIKGGTKWLVLDVDDSVLSAEDTHFMLSDINHHIALSSDPENFYKFRVLIELDAVVDINAIAWKAFYSEIANDLAINVDPLPQSQIFFSYAGRPVMSVTDAEPLQVRNYVMNAIEIANNKDITERKLSSSQRSVLLNDALETFGYAFTAKNGTGSRNMIRAAYHAQRLGARLEETLELLKNINAYWIQPMESTRFEALLAQVERIY